MTTSTATTAAEVRPADRLTFHNGAIGTWNAWFFETFDRYINFITRHHKRHAFDGIVGGVVVELGTGVGANFEYLPSAGSIVAIEPNEAMHDRLRRRADACGVEVDIVGAPAERIPLDDGSVDTVIASLVLCTVGDPVAVVTEVLRILKPGGTFRFVEHVAARPVSPRRLVQVTIARPWSWLYEGCRLCQDTATIIETAGFATVDTKRHRLRQSLFFPVNSAISGIAVKRGGDSAPPSGGTH